MSSLRNAIAANQLAASNPNVNVWVNASAGSGKTKVLIDRMLRLLLQKVSPKTIVCLTFTQAAALEMQQRLQFNLEKWVMLNDMDLTEDLKRLDSTLIISQALLVQARSLFNYVLDEPVQIQTIHSFAQKILYSCPGESQLPFGAKLLDEVNAKRLIQRAIQEVFNVEEQSGELKQVYHLFSYSRFNDIIHKIVEEQAFFRFVFIEGRAHFQEKLKRYLNHPRSEEIIQAEIIAKLKEFDFTKLCDVTNASDNDKVLIANVLKAMAQQSTDMLTDILLTDKGTPRKRLLSKKLSELYPEETLQLNILTQEVFEWDQEVKKSKTIKSTMLVLDVAERFLKTYTKIKNDQGVLDYDDLIFKTLELLSDSSKSTQILYKLDNVVHHLLVDEAQDTNLYQWKLIELIVEEFFQSDQHKTFFVVGDHKQSIFGFQGTDPDIFQHMKHRYYQKPSVRAWEEVSLDVSFRSLQSILDFVDSIFDNQNLITPYSKHRAFRGVGGQVVIHPLCVPSEEPEELLYEKFAIQIGNQIESLIGSSFNDKGVIRAIHPADILVLIRKRGEHLDALQIELQRRKIPFSAPVRQLVYENDFVRFIMHTVTCMVQPLDNYIVIQWLLNPLIGLKEEGMESAIQRVQMGGTLMEDLKSHPIFISIVKATTGYTSLEDMYVKVCIWGIQNLSLEPHHIANALMLLDFLKTWEWVGDRLNYTYTEFTHHVMSLAIPQLNRTAEDAVRILTVHGAKGLQAPVVILIDTTQLPITRNVWVQNDRADLFLCLASSKDETIEYQALKAQQKENELKEYYRLLYVGLTRAENELHIFGCTKGKVMEEAWYTLCSN
jgi:ATP-dependent helicase/nuclease subunit A